MSAVVAVYADGGVVAVNPSPHGGTWAWCHVDADNQRVAHASGFVPPEVVGLPTVSNNVTELIALVSALEALPDGWSGNVYTDSLNALCRVRDHATQKFKACPDHLKERVVKVRRRLGALTFTLLGGHPTRADLRAGHRPDGLPVSEHNVWCDKSCGERAKDRERVVGHVA
ncbi:---NA--- : : RNase_H [Gemmataceae bacterium]|nr:---NA--- : : RNase_H [Gemmataceae bacterium]VTT98912.1 ---NA--- : : RNase_H [Gemmataceae bacterium]